MRSVIFTGKIELVKEIVVNLAKAVGVYQELGPSAWQPLPVERFLELDSSKMIAPKTQYKMLFSNNFGQMNGWVHILPSIGLAIIADMVVQGMKKRRKVFRDRWLKNY